MKVRHTFPSYRCGLPYDDPQNSKVEERIFSISGFTNESSHAGSADWEESSNLYSVLCYNLDTILSDKYFRGKNLTVRSSTKKLKKYWGSKIGLKKLNPEKDFRSNPSKTRVKAFNLKVVYEVLTPRLSGLDIV